MFIRYLRVVILAITFYPHNCGLVRQSGEIQRLKVWTGDLYGQVEFPTTAVIPKLLLV